MIWATAGPASQINNAAPTNLIVILHALILKCNIAEDAVSARLAIVSTMGFSAAIGDLGTLVPVMVPTWLSVRWNCGVPITFGTAI
jgi:hypothetical protein